MVDLLNCDDVIERIIFQYPLTHLPFGELTATIYRYCCESTVALSNSSLCSPASAGGGYSCRIISICVKPLFRNETSMEFELLHCIFQETCVAHTKTHSVRCNIYCLFETFFSQLRYQINIDAAFNFSLSSCAAMYIAHFIYLKSRASRLLSTLAPVNAAVLQRSPWQQ